MVEVWAVAETHIHSCVMGEHMTPRLEPTVSGIDHTIDHHLEEEPIPHPLRDDDVDLFGQLNVLPNG